MFTGSNRKIRLLATAANRSLSLLRHQQMNRNSSMPVRLIFSYSDTDTAATTAFHNKVLMSVTSVLYRYDIDLEVSPHRPDVFILTPESALRIENLLKPLYPYRVRGMTVTFSRYTLSVEDGAQECDEDDMCAICHDYLQEEQTTKPSCQHEFHERCLRHWASVCSSQEHRVSCPQCRANLIN